MTVAPASRPSSASSPADPHQTKSMNGRTDAPRLVAGAPSPVRERSCDVRSSSDLARSSFSRAPPGRRLFWICSRTVRAARGSSSIREVIW